MTKQLVLSLFDSKPKPEQVIRKSTRYANAYIIPNITGHVFINESELFTDMAGITKYKVPYVFYSHKWYQDELYLTIERYNEIINDIRGI